MSDMRRRAFISLLGGAAAWPIAAWAQQGERMRRIGVLMGLDPDDASAAEHLRALKGGLGALGWVEETWLDAAGRPGAFAVRTGDGRLQPPASAESAMSASTPHSVRPCAPMWRMWRTPPHRRRSR